MIHCAVIFVKGIFEKKEKCYIHLIIGQMKDEKHNLVSIKMYKHISY